MARSPTRSKAESGGGSHRKFFQVKTRNRDQSLKSDAVFSMKSEWGLQGLGGTNSKWRRSFLSQCHMRATKSSWFAWAFSSFSTLGNPPATGKPGQLVTLLTCKWRIIGLWAGFSGFPVSSVRHSPLGLNFSSKSTRLGQTCRKYTLWGRKGQGGHFPSMGPLVRDGKPFMRLVFFKTRLSFGKGFLKSP